jgi:uncharacterized membrane protein YphA (DoxX/SURF4 family)
MRSIELLNHLPLVFAALFVAILFIQSGLDKVFDYKGNLEWLTGHFAKSPLAKTVPLLLPTITIMELATGVLAYLLFYASIAGAVSLTALFFGQRVAKDYPGAAVLVPYFILLLILMYLSRTV